TVTFTMPANLEGDQAKPKARWSDDLEKTRSFRLTGAAVLGGTGLAGITFGGVLGALAASKWSAAQDACPALTACASSEGQTLSREARTECVLSTLGFGIGAGALI